MTDSLSDYRRKRSFDDTPEPAGDHAQSEGSSFVVQKHWARRLHYDFRLELDGVMKSWAVPKGPSYDPADKRMAVQVEDHPVAYNQFEGEIAPGNYGAGKVIIWDEGHWTPLGDARAGLAAGMLKLQLDGVKLKGKWALIRMKRKGDKQVPWLLIKEKDEYVQSSESFSVVDSFPDSVVPLREGRGSTTSRHASSQKELPATSAALPSALKPQLATLVDAVPGQPKDWLFEVKFDGYRLMARVDGDDIKLFTRNGHDWTNKMPHIAQALGKLGLQSAWLDGEVVVTNDQGVPDFQALQNAFDHRRTQSIKFILFDAPFLSGRDLRQEPLTVRREALTEALGRRPPAALQFSETFDVKPSDLIVSACKLGLEGVIGKRRDSTYVSRRADSWIKLKCAKRQEFVIVGFTDPKGARKGFGSLLLAVHDEDGELRYAGNVGTGFGDNALRTLDRQLRKIETTDSPLKDRKGVARQAHWTEPSLIAEVTFGDWTDTGRIRHAVFKGLRSDKAPAAITREHPVAPPATSPDARSSAKRAPSTTLKISHPDRVIDPTSGATKLDLVRYYDAVAPLLIEHLVKRPVSLVRAPAGVKGELFFQKHLEGRMPGVLTLDPALDPDHPPLLEVPTREAILSAAQMNVVEFHTWNAVKTAIDRPDRMTFDLDPGEGAAWSVMQESVQLVRVLLEEIGLQSYVKTSGGKGLHVVVPIRKQHDWATVKSFTQHIAVHLAKTLPKIFVSKSGPSNRINKIFVDYLRNGFGATTASAWSARARPGLGVSVPVGWDEVTDIRSGAHWTIHNAEERMAVGNSPWQGATAQPVSRAMSRLGFKP